MFILLKLDRKKLIVVPSIISLGLIFKFIVDNISRLKQIRDTYNCFAGFRYGLIVIVIGNLVVLLTLLFTIVDFSNLFELLKNMSIKVLSFIKSLVSGIRNIYIKRRQLMKLSKIEKLNKKENKQRVTQEMTKDGKIKFNKIVIKVDNNVERKKSLKERLNLFVLKHKVRKISRKKISITKYKDEVSKKVYNVPVIDIKRWTRDDVCCLNCGATVKSTSEYCFLCDSKIVLNDKEKLS